jgi:hypothetical protein
MAVADVTIGESEHKRLEESERRQRILSEISATLLEYVSADEEEPLRRIVDKVVQGFGDWCAFSLIQPTESCGKRPHTIPIRASAISPTN